MLDSIYKLHKMCTYNKKNPKLSNALRILLFICAHYHSLYFRVQHQTPEVIVKNADNKKDIKLSHYTSARYDENKRNAKLSNALSILLFFIIPCKDIIESLISFFQSCVFPRQNLELEEAQVPILAFNRCMSDQLLQSSF